MTEREHELRNGLLGLTGVTRLLSEGGDRGGCRQAWSAAVTELNRLAQLVGGRTQAAVDGPFGVGEVIEKMVALWRLNGMQIATTTTDDLVAVGRSAVLAQVLTNLLTNCAQHAPGAPVCIVAGRSGNAVVVQLRNEASAATYRDCYGRHVSAARRGIGLPLSRRLLQAQGGDLVVHPFDPRRPGFTTSIMLRTTEPARLPMPVHK